MPYATQPRALKTPTKEKIADAIRRVCYANGEPLSMAVTKVVMPKLSEQMESGRSSVAQEGRRPGAERRNLAEVETDKADVEMEAFGGGVLAQDTSCPRASRCRGAP